MFLETFPNSQENQNLFSNKVAPEQVFSCEFCRISKNTFSKEHLRATASVIISENKLWKALLHCSNFVKKSPSATKNVVFLYDRVSFWDKIGCFVTRLCTFAQSYSPTYFFNLQGQQIYCGRNPALAYPALFLS